MITNDYLQASLCGLRYCQKNTITNIFEVFYLKNKNRTSVTWTSTIFEATYSICFLCIRQVERPNSFWPLIAANEPHKWNVYI